MIDSSIEVFKIKYFIFCSDYESIYKLIPKLGKKSFIITIYNILCGLRN